jgi:GNAT superfamily N-acetyltransferase
VPKEPSGDLRVEPLASAHDRSHFVCGVESLDFYPRTQAGQDIRRKANAVFVLVRAARPKDVLGYFTLCATALNQGDVPEPARKLVPRYPLVSATLIGRLAVAKHGQGRGLGSVLLAQALHKAYESASTVGSSMVVVDALDESACGFYAAHSFVRLPDSMRLVLPIGSIEKLLGEPGAP